MRQDDDISILRYLKEVVISSKCGEQQFCNENIPLHLEEQKDTVSTLWRFYKQHKSVWRAMFVTIIYRWRMHGWKIFTMRVEVT